MTDLCNAGVTARLRFPTAPRDCWEREEAMHAYSLHLAQCQTCRAHVTEQAEAARNATHPDLTEKQINELEPE